MATQTHATPALPRLLLKLETGFLFIEKKNCDRQNSFNYKCQTLNSDSHTRNKTKFMAHKQNKIYGSQGGKAPSGTVGSRATVSLRAVGLALPPSQKGSVLL